MKSYDKRHAGQVSRLSKEIYLSLFGENEYELKLLEAGALYHDISDVSPHNKTGAQMILDNGLDGFNRRELIIIANIIRYHRGAHPKDEHTFFSLVENDDKELAKRLSAIVRLADVLDFKHYSHIDEMKIEIKEDKILFYLLPDVPTAKGFDSAFNMKKRLFEEVFEKKVVLKDAD